MKKTIICVIDKEVLSFGRERERDHDSDAAREEREREDRK